MLNPHDYLEDCIRQNITWLWHLGMPWAVLDSVIDTESGEYHVSEAQRTAFEQFVSSRGSSHLHWDNLDDGSEKILACPKCKYEVLPNRDQVRVPWSTAGQAFAQIAAKLTRFKDEPPRTASQQKRDFDKVNAAAEAGQGYADKGLDFICHYCSTRIDHEALRAGAFLMDAVRWRLKPSPPTDKMQWSDADSSVPMKGTILDNRGIPAGNYRYDSAVHRFELGVYVC